MDSILIDNQLQESRSGLPEPDMNLLDLPCVVLDRLMEYMDPSALKTLRSVSRDMKSLAETPKILERIRVKIINMIRLEEIKKSEVEWNNIWISTIPGGDDDGTTLPTSDYAALVQFLQSRQNTLAILRLSLCKSDHFADFIFNLGPNLKHLTLDGPSRSSTIEDELRKANELKILLNESREILERNFSGLRRVQFKRGFGQGLLTCLIDTFLKCCSDSISINIPMVRLADGDGSEMSKEEKEVKCAPLIAYLERMSELKGIRPRTIIDFWAGTNSKSLHKWCITEYISPVPLTRSVMTKLAILCEVNRVKLANVPSSALPESHVLTNKEKKCIDKCIESILCLNDPTGIIGYTPPSCVVQVIVSARLPGKDFSSFNIPDTTNVTSIFIDGGTRQLFNDNRGINVDIMLHNLLQVYRPKVTELVLRGCFGGVELKLGQFLPNLTRLILYDLRWEKEIKNLLNGLEKLRHLTLKDCHFNNKTGPSTDHWFPMIKSLRSIQMEGCTFDLKLTRCKEPSMSAAEQNLI